jgi:glycerophosphoryl diester phosphodiesterase
MVTLSSILKRVLHRRPAALVWPPLMIGHRGASGEAPENTLVSFELAWQQGADGIELDVHLSSDGVPVVIHDSFLRRTTSGSGRVNEHRVRMLKRLDAGSWFNRRYPFRARERYPGVRIPLLSEAFRWVRTRQCQVFVEIKDPAPGAEGRVLKEVERAGVWDLVRIISFDLPTLERVRQMNSTIRRGIDVSRRLQAIPRAQALEAEMLLPHWAIASRKFIRSAHLNTLRVIPWTINNPYHMRRKILDGVDGIITNYPARLTAVLERLDRTCGKGQRMKAEV